MPLSPDLLSAKVAAYVDGNLSLDQFADWFLDNSREMFGESLEMREALLSIDNTLSEFRYGVMTAQDLRDELAKAVQPFAFAVNSYGDPSHAILESNAENFSNSVAA
jgi:hypothetical protein